MSGIFGAFRNIFSGAFRLAFGANPNKTLEDLANKLASKAELSERSRKTGERLSLAY